MTPEQAKAYVNKRYKEMQDDGQDKLLSVNIILKELREQNFYPLLGNMPVFAVGVQDGYVIYQGPM